MKDGDLWKAFQEAAAHKNPWAVWLTKLKGHATDKEVEEGKVPEEQKICNDYSDEAAGKGSRGEQEKLAAVTALYNRRGNAYQTNVHRVLDFLVNMKKEETELRQKIMKEANPFADKDKDKIFIPTNLSYADEEKELLKSLYLRPPRRAMAKSDAHHE